MSQAEGPIPAPEPGLRWYQFRLRTLLLLAVPVALLAMYLKDRFFYPKPVKESAFLASLEPFELELMLCQLLPQPFFNGSQGGGGTETSPQRGKWLRQLKGVLTCDEDVADRAMRSFRSELQKAVRQHGGKTGEEEETLEGSFLVGFRFDYVEGEHRGRVEAALGPRIPMAPPGFNWPPQRRLVVRIGESVGFPRGVEVKFWDYRPPREEDSTRTTFYLPLPASRGRSGALRSRGAGRGVAR